MADHYGTVPEADAYHLARGNTEWAGTEAEKLAALVRASQYVDGLAGQTSSAGCVYQWPGVKTGGREQRLAWPRQGATDSDGFPLDKEEVPAEVEDATYEAALRELVSPGSLLPDYDPLQSSIIKREKVDVLETEYAVPTLNDPNALRPIFGQVLAILAPVLECRRANGFAMAVV